MIVNVNTSPSTWRTLATSSLGFMLIQLDVTIVNVGLPHIAETFHGSIAGLQWVVDAYTLVFAGMMLSAGALADRYSARRAFMGGVVLFALASIICAASVSLEMLIAARIVQGMGAALVMPSSLALVRDAFPTAAPRAHAIGVWGAAGGAATAAGPVVGGALIAWLGWRSLFWVNVPLGVIAVGLLPREAGRRHHPVTINAANTVYVTGAVALLVAGLITAPASGWIGIQTFVYLAAGLALFALFLGMERRAARPLIPSELAGDPRFHAIVAGGFIVNVGFYGLVFVLSLYWQDVRDLSPLATGFTFLPLTLQVIFTSLIASRWVARDRGMLPIIAGFALAACGYIGLLLVNRAASVGTFFLPLLAVGVGTVTAVTALTAGVLARVSTVHAGKASAAFNAARQMGAATGVAIFGALVADRARFLHGMDVAMTIAAAISLGAVLLIGYTSFRFPSVAPVDENADGNDGR